LDKFQQLVDKKNSFNLSSIPLHLSYFTSKRATSLRGSSQLSHFRY